MPALCGTLVSTPLDFLEILYSSVLQGLGVEETLFNSSSFTSS